MRCFYSSLAVSAAAVVLFHTLPTHASVVESEDVFPHPSGKPLTNIETTVFSMFGKRASISGIEELGKRGGMDSFTGILRRNIWEMMGSEYHSPEQQSTASESLTSLRRRQTTNTTTTASASNPTSTVTPASTTYTGYDPTTWDADVLSHCKQTLTGVTASGNPAGVVVCYNLPYVNMTTGIFASDLRLYRVSPASAAWTALGGNVSISLQYQNAMVQIANFEGTKVKREADAATTTASSTSTSTSAEATGAGDPILMQTFRFVGQVNSDMMEKSLGMDAVNASALMETTLTPNVALVGVNSAGTMMNTSLPFLDAYFLTGVFSKDTNTTAVGTKLTTPKFILPGTYIQIVPVGLYLTAAWTGLFVLIIGFGTFERYQFRMFYRKKIAGPSASGKFGKFWKKDMI